MIEHMYFTLYNLD